MEINHWLEDWLSARAEAPGTKGSYLMCWRNLTRFSHGRGHDPLRLVEDYRAVKFQGEIQRERFLEEWQDILRAWNTWLKPRYAPFSRKNQLVAIRSFLNYWKIPLDLELPRHPYVLYHNRDLTKEQLPNLEPVHKLGSHPFRKHPMRMCHSRFSSWRLIFPVTQGLLFSLKESSSCCRLWKE